MGSNQFSRTSILERIPTGNRANFSHVVQRFLARRSRRCKGSFPGLPIGALNPLSYVNPAWKHSILRFSQGTTGPLFLMESMAHEGMTMGVVTHEMGFARKAADRILFMDGGEILEEGSPQLFFGNPKHPRT